MKNEIIGLSDEGEAIAKKAIDRLKSSIKKALSEQIEDTLNDIYCGALPHLEADIFCNYRRQIEEEMEQEKPAGYRSSRIREAMFNNHKDEIIKDINQDLLDKIKDLESENKRLKEGSYYR